MGEQITTSEELLNENQETQIVETTEAADAPTVVKETIFSPERPVGRT